MKQKFKVPEGTTNVTIEQIGNQIITTFESEPKFKKGDFVTSDEWDGAIAIFLSDEKLTAWCHPSGAPIHNPASCNPQRKATPKEKQFLLDKLHKQGKDWDFEMCYFIDYI